MSICPICKNDNSAGESFLPDYYYCNNCGGYFAKGKVVVSYSEEYFQEKSKPSFISQLAGPILNLFLKLRVKKIKSIVGKRNVKILDFGCGRGGLVKALIKKDFNVVGFEPSVDARAIAERKKLPVYDKIRSVSDGYDLIMFWQSLEHISAPLEIIKTIKNYLAQNGKILIAIPNAASFEARIFKENWFHYTYPLHRIHFTPESAKLMLQKAGFSVIQTDFFNLEYTISGLVQSFLNWFLPENVLYSVLSHRRLSMPLLEAIIFALISILLLLIFSPLLIIFFLIELIFRKTGAIVIIAERTLFYENKHSMPNVPKPKSQALF